MLAEGWANAKWTETDSVPKWREIKNNKRFLRVLSAHTHRKCSKRCQENVTLAKTKHDAIRIVCNWITTQKTKNERAKGEPKI